MKSIIVTSAFLALTFVKCNSDNTGCNPACDPARKTVKEVIDKLGRVDYNQEEDKWLIIASSSPVSYDSQDLGIVCSDLDEEFKQVGNTVRFSGEYKEKCGDNKGSFPGQTYYYLHLSAIEIINDN